MTALEKGTNPWLVALVVSLATFMEVLDTTITNVSLSHISGTLGAGQEESTWVLTSYLVANGIVLPLSGWLSNVMGRRNFFLLCIAGFTAASFACGASTSLGMLVFFRLIQGLAGGGLQPTQQAIMVDIFPPEKRGQAFALTGITIIVAPILGPTLGGWITDNFDWRWIFFINLPVGALAFFLVSRLLHDPPHAKARGAGAIDYIGLSLVAIGLGSLQIVMDKGQQEDWFESSFILTMAAVSLSCLAAAVFWLLRQKDPVVDLSVLKERGFAVCCLLVFFTGFVLYSSSTLLPLMVQTQFGYDATLAGLVLSPGGLVVIFVMPLAGKLVAKVEARVLIAVGLALSAFGMWHTMHLTPQSGYSAFVLMRITQIVGIPFLFVPSGTLAFSGIPKEKSNKASALYALARNLGGSIGIAFTTTWLARHTQIEQAALVTHLSPANPVYARALAHAPVQMIWRGLQQQAGLLAYRDCFALLTGIMLAGIFLTFLLPRNKPKAAPPDAAAH
jgi:DHA2 family multidrug resistance protein